MPIQPVTRASLISRVATRANTSGYADATTVGGEVSQLVDVSCAKMHNLLVALYEDYFIDTALLSLRDGQDVYPAPANLFKYRQVFYTDTSGYRWPLKQLNLDDLTGLPLSQTYQSAPSGYFVLRNSMQIFPMPSDDVDNCILIYYIPGYAPPANDDTTLETYSFALGWDEWIITDACINIRNKSMMPVDELVQERARIEQDIKHQAKQRNAGDPKRIRDTGWGGGSFGNRYSSFALK